MFNWDWIPTQSVGPFRFEKGLPDLQGAQFELLPPDMEDADWQTYSVADEEARVAVRDGLVISVECTYSLRFNGHELVGLSISDANDLLPEETQLVRTYEDGEETWVNPNLGLMLWVEDEVIKSATVSSHDS